MLADHSTVDSSPPAKQANRRGRGRRRHGDTLRSLDSDDPQAQQVKAGVREIVRMGLVCALWRLDDYCCSVAHSPFFRRAHQQRSLPVSDTPELDDFAESVALEEKGIGVNDLTANFGLLEPPVVVCVLKMCSVAGLPGGLLVGL